MTIKTSCKSCGAELKDFENKNEMMIYFKKPKKCPICGLTFETLFNGTVWGLNIRESNEEIDLFWNMTHPIIMKISQKLFENKHYPQAVFEAFKAVNNRVKSIYKIKANAELDGRDLMFQAFSNNGPIILDDVSTQTGKDIQEGYKFIFGGSMQAIRNPKAHEEIHITDKRAKHFLILASLLMDKLDEKNYP